MKSIATFSFFLFVSFSIHAQWIQMGTKLVGTGATGMVGRGSCVSLSADGKTLATSGYYDNNRIGATWVYTLSDSGWVQMGNKLVGSGYVGVPYQGFSISLSADGQTLAIGAYADNKGVGAAWVFVLSDTGWAQSGNKLIGSGAIGNGGQGTSVSLSADGKILAVGGSYDDNGRGATWVYKLSDSGWIQMGNKLVGSGAVGSFGVHQGSGVSLSADGKTLAVGGDSDNNNIITGGYQNVGATWIFNLSDTGWVQMGNKLVGTGYVEGQVSQGLAVKLSADGKTLAVGGLNDNKRTGATWVFKLSGQTWVQVGEKLVGTGGVGNTAQGVSVSLSADGNILAVGGCDDNNYAGATWLYTISDTDWSQTGNKLQGYDAFAHANGSGQGVSVSLSADGKTLAVGGPNDNNWVGGAWVYTTNTVITGLKDPSRKSTQVYPNPTQGKITVYTCELGNLEIYDSNGAFKRMFKVESLNQQIDIQELNVGSYFYRFTTNDGVKFGKVVKQ